MQPSEPTDWILAYNQMAEVYSNETDRAAAILASSFIDEQLERLLIALLVDDSRVREMFEGDRPLAAFSARVNFAFSIGLLPLNVYADLNLIRKIRNDFAHSATAVSFDLPPARDRCAALSVVKSDSGTFIEVAARSKPRDQFLLAIVGTNVYLQHVLGGLQNGALKRFAVPPTVRMLQ